MNAYPKLVKNGDEDILVIPSEPSEHTFCGRSALQIACDESSRGRTGTVTIFCPKLHTT